MELLSLASPESFHGDNCCNFQDSDDSGLSSSPSSPMARSNDFLADLFDFDRTYCNALNASLFDGEFASHLYTHIKIKDDNDDEMWCNTTPLEVNSKGLSLKDNSASPCLDYFDSSFERIAEMLNPQLSTPQVDGIPTKPCAEVSNNVNTSPRPCTPSLSSESGEESVNTASCSPNITYDSPTKPELRTRRKRRQICRDHDYCKVKAVSDSEADSDEDFKVEQDVEDEDSDDVDDEDYKVPCPSKKARKAHSKTLKDAKYWERRQRNNLAAKRSREAKRAREIQVAKKTAALEKENVNLKKQVRKLKAEIKKAEKMLCLVV